jgi:hypothetical protein
MAHKQLFGLKDQLGLVNYQLGEVAKLEAEAPQAGDSAPFPVVMSATVVGLSLKQARNLLQEAADMLTGEINFYEASDRRIEEFQASTDENKATAIEAETKNASAREALTAGRAAYCMQSVGAANIFMLKGMEKARSYRS